MGLPNKLRKRVLHVHFLKNTRISKKTSCSHVQKNLQPFSNEKTNKEEQQGPLRLLATNILWFWAWFEFYKIGRHYQNLFQCNASKVPDAGMTSNTMPQALRFLCPKKRMMGTGTDSCLEWASK